MAGWLMSAAAAAQGAEPDPASLEKRPRLAPFMITAPIPPAAAWRRPKASANMRWNTEGSRPAFFTIMKIVIAKYRPAIIGTIISSTFTVAFFRSTITAAIATSATVV